MQIGETYRRNADDQLYILTSRFMHQDTGKYTWQAELVWAGRVFLGHSVWIQEDDINFTQAP